MIIYADILVIINFIVDYFLFLTAGFLLKAKVHYWRYIIGSLIGGISSLYIFLSFDGVIFDLMIKVLVNIVCSLVIFGFGCFKKFIKSFLSVFIITALYGGVMTAVLHIFKPNGMFARNSVVYFSISPLALIAFTVIFYFLFLLISVIFKPSAVKSEKCGIELFAEDKRITFTAIIDSGNSLNDVFGNSEIIIGDKSVVTALFDKTDIYDDVKLKSRYRAIPCGTVGGCEILDGYRCDKAKITTLEKSFILEKPILAVSKFPLKDGYEGIVNPEIFD